MADGASQSRCHKLSITGESVRGLRDLATDQIKAVVKMSMREYAGRFPGGRDVPLPEGVKLLTTTDLALATYLDMNGCPVVVIRPNTDPRAGRHQASEFVIADHDGSANRISLAFVSSEPAKFNARMGILKKEAIRVRDMGRG